MADPGCYICLNDDMSWMTTGWVNPSRYHFV